MEKYGEKNRWKTCGELIIVYKSKICDMLEFNKISISFRKLHNQESQLYSWGGLRDHSGLFETCLQGQGSKLQKWLNKRARKMGVNHLKDKQNITLFVTQPNRAEKKWQLSYQISLVIYLPIVPKPLFA